MDEISDIQISGRGEGLLRGAHQKSSVVDGIFGGFLAGRLKVLALLALAGGMLTRPAAARR